MLASDEASRSQTDRILNSESLRSSVGLQRLLRFLLDKAATGKADQLKEYSIGIDLFGKAASYDPRHDSTVRIQVGRLRQKLAEYYQGEGKDDPVLVDLPKGHYKLEFQPRLRNEAAPEVRTETEQSRKSRTANRWLTPALAGCLIATTAWAAFATSRLWTTDRMDAVLRESWTPDMTAVWGPFVDSPRPLVVSTSAPMFIDLPGFGLFRDVKVNRREDIPKSPAIAALAKALGVKPASAVFYGTLGGATSSFILGKVLALRKTDLTLVTDQELSWRQISESNVVLIGSPHFFERKLANMPVKMDFDVESGVGIRNLNRRPNELDVYKDDHNGTTWTLASRIRGPRGTEVMSFTANMGAGLAAAVSSFTEPAKVREMVAKLRQPSGKMPQYYQVLLKVRYQDGVPIETSYVLHHELR